MTLDVRFGCPPSTPNPASIGAELNRDAGELVPVTHLRMPEAYRRMGERLKRPLHMDRPGDSLTTLDPAPAIYPGGWFPPRVCSGVPPAVPL